MEKEYRSNLQRLQKIRKDSDRRRREENKGYSLENLKLTTLLNQLQALQAVQGFQELRPKDKNRKSRFEIPEDPRERENRLRWLTFKADWLEALLEDTLDELAAIENYRGGEARRCERETIKILASYEIVIDNARSECKSCCMVDISVGGMQLLLDEQVQVNTPLKVNLHDGTALEGLVVWSKKLQDAVEKYTTGVALKNVNTQIIERIQKLIGDFRHKEE